MDTDQFKLASLYSRAHDIMRNVDGLQPQEAFDELLKFLFCRQSRKSHGQRDQLATSRPKLYRSV